MSSIRQQRKALNANGHLGSLYNAWKDHLIISSEQNLRVDEVKSSARSRCEIITGNSSVSHNILRSINIEKELRLSLLLDLTSFIGITAILNDDYRINNYTRLLCYTWTHRDEHVSNETLKQLNWNWLLKNNTSATHVIFGITYGIDVIVLLCISEDDRIVNDIESVLHRIRSAFLNDTDMTSLITPTENQLLLRHTKITIYSNIADLTGSQSISECLGKIDRIRKNPQQCCPVSYSLSSLTPYCSGQTRENIVYRTLPAEICDHLEQYVLDKRSSITSIKSLWDQQVDNSCIDFLDGEIHGVRERYRMTKTKYIHELEKLSQLLINFRNGQIEAFPVREALLNEDRCVKEDLKELTERANDLKSKERLIRDLRKNNISYRSAVDYDLNERDDDRSVQTKLCMHTKSTRILCSTDVLNKHNVGQLNQYLSNLLNERRNDSHLHVIYADFSYSSYKLHKMMILTSDQTRKPVASLPNNRIINILLLGETGVGKSTFINAFANYLTFSSLTEAQSNQPVVVIPVSFLVSVGNQFEERVVKFGKLDHINNENFNSVGQSVTQNCRSYLFDLRQHGQQLRIIDTPGFGDTRGLEQDNYNMEHILQYINNLTHLDAICFLLKPNSSRLNMFFRTCLTQLFSFLAPAARRNVLFCFTNARSTFYTPGDTAPLLKQMLKSSSIQDIPFRKENTFCFDSESFRYLVALRNGISFTEVDRNEYEKSWSISVKESHRLIEYVQRNLRPYRMRNDWQSIKHAQLEISNCIRPILEMIRNLLRNCYRDQPKDINHILRQLYTASAEFSYFLIHGARSTKDDLFRLGLLQMIREEESHSMNHALVNELKRVCHDYNQRLQEIASDRNERTLKNVYDQLRRVQNYPEIHKQIQAVQQSEQALMKQREIVV